MVSRDSEFVILLGIPKCKFDKDRNKRYRIDFLLVT